MISLEYLGSEGVFVVQEGVDKERVSGYVRCYISASSHAHLDLSVRVVGTDGYEIETYTERISKLSEEWYVDIPFSIDDPI